MSLLDYVIVPQNFTSDPIETIEQDLTNGRVSYLGLSAVGYAKSDPAWTILKFTYTEDPDTNTLITDIRRSPPASIWDNRKTTVTYS